MGQEQSVAAAAAETNETTTSASPPPPSLDSLIAEAAAYGDEVDSDSPETKAQKALDCPCIAHLRTGPCGAQFSGAFVCFLKSTAEEKGSDCVNPFVALQKCIQANPDAFSKDVLDDEEEVKKKEEEEKVGPPQSSVRPPLWSAESKTRT